MTRDRAVLDFRRSFPNRDGFWDLTARVLEDPSVPGAAHAPLRPQVLHQLFFQYAPRLNEQATVNRFGFRVRSAVILAMRNCCAAAVSEGAQASAGEHLQASSLVS
jgi:hypothetical protein